MLYVVTVSDHYYPMSGTDDWALVSRSKSEALSYLRNKDIDEYYQTGYVIEISDDGNYKIIESLP